MEAKQGKQRVGAVHGEGRLLARPGVPVDPAGAVGLQRLGLGEARDGLLYVPAGYEAGRSAPLVVMLHGAGGNAENALQPFLGVADARGLMLLAPESQGSTWDVIALGRYGPDVAFLDAALAATFARYAVDPRRVAIAGFSDGASYALSLGVANGGLWSHVIAFAPGFMAPLVQEGAPQVFVVHGVHDTVLPIARCSRRLVPQLEWAGYAVCYQEFDGPHVVPPDMVEAALDWFLANEGGRQEVENRK